MASGHDLYDTGNSLQFFQKFGAWYAVSVTGYALKGPTRPLPSSQAIQWQCALSDREKNKQSAYRLSTPYSLSKSHYSTISEQQKMLTSAPA